MTDQQKIERAVMDAVEQVLLPRGIHMVPDGFTVSSLSESPTVAKVEFKVRLADAPTAERFGERCCICLVINREDRPAIAVCRNLTPVCQAHADECRRRGIPVTDYPKGPTE